MKYKIGDYVEKNNILVKIVDIEIIDGYNIYYFSDKTSNEESKFNIIADTEINRIIFEKALVELVKQSKITTKIINKEYKEWLEKRKKESSFSYKFKKFIRNILEFSNS